MCCWALCDPSSCKSRTCCALRNASVSVGSVLAIALSTSENRQLVLKEVTFNCRVDVAS